MKPKKPDKFTKAVNKLTFTASPLSLGCRAVSPYAAIALLRKEHAAVVRIVKNVLNESIVRDLPETGPGYQCACRHILDQLKRREK